MLDEDTSRHVVQVLRMKTGDQLQLIDGKGIILKAGIVDDHKKKCIVKVQETRYKAARKIIIAVSMLKNSNRFEWFFEKATEIELAVQHHFIPVALGSTRLRTETAAIIAAALIKIT